MTLTSQIKVVLIRSGTARLGSIVCKLWHGSHILSPLWAVMILHITYSTFFTLHTFNTQVQEVSTQDLKIKQGRLFSLHEGASQESELEFRIWQWEKKKWPE